MEQTKETTAGTESGEALVNGARRVVENLWQRLEDPDRTTAEAVLQKSTVSANRRQFLGGLVAATLVAAGCGNLPRPIEVDKTTPTPARPTATPFPEATATKVQPPTATTTQQPTIQPTAIEQPTVFPSPTVKQTPPVEEVKPTPRPTPGPKNLEIRPGKTAEIVTIKGEIDPSELSWLRPQQYTTRDNAIFGSDDIEPIVYKLIALAQKHPDAVVILGSGQSFQNLPTLKATQAERIITGIPGRLIFFGEYLDLPFIQRYPKQSRTVPLEKIRSQFGSIIGTVGYSGGGAYLFTSQLPNQEVPGVFLSNPYAWILEPVFVIRLKNDYPYIKETTKIYWPSDKE